MKRKAGKDKKKRYRWGKRSKALSAEKKEVEARGETFIKVGKKRSHAEVEEE